jgi:hypothetical protein
VVHLYAQSIIKVFAFAFNSSIGACFFPTLLITIITLMGMESAD